MRTDALGKTLLYVGGFVGFAYLVIGVVGGLWPGHWDDAGAADEILWYVFLVGGGLILLVGLRLFRARPWIGALLVSVGAVAGALPIFWTGISLLVALVLVVVSVLYARRQSAASG